MHNVGQWQRWFSLLMKTNGFVWWKPHLILSVTVLIDVPRCTLIDLQQCFDIYLTAGALSMFSAFM